MKGFLKILIVLILVLAIPMTTFGADALYRFMHNDHDALVIAEVIEIDSEQIIFRVEKSIVSDKDLNMYSKTKQQKFDEFTMYRKVLSNISLYGDISNEDNFIKEGDSYIISLNKKLSNFEVAWGAYKVSSLDYKTLDIIYPKNAPEWRIMEATAIKYFVNSDGKKTEFSFNGSENTVKSGTKVIYDGSGELDSEDPNNSKIKEVENQEPLKEVAKVDQGSKILKPANNKLVNGILPFVLAGIAMTIVFIRARNK